MQNKLYTQEEYEFIGKSVFFPKQGILVVGDLHLGYEFTIRQPGSYVPATQFSETKKDLEDIFEVIKKRGNRLKKVIFLGDVKHFFSYMRAEKNLFEELLMLIGKHVKQENIIVIKGNHEKLANLADKEFVEIHKEKDLAFIHGDIENKQAFTKEIKTILMGHLHPAINLKDSQGIKSEKYKTFLLGKYKKKNIIILPSFLPSVEGTSINQHLSDTHCFLPAKKLQDFKVFIIGKNKTYEFGLLNSLMK